MNLKINLIDLEKMLNEKPLREYAVAVIDNRPPDLPKIPLICKNHPGFIWINKFEIGYVPVEREKLEKIFFKYGIEVKNSWIAVFNHHDLQKPYLKFKNKVECYEFSHIDSLAYKAFCHADANFLSHMLSKTFYKYDKVELVKANLSKDKIKELQNKHWIFKEFFEKIEGVGEEESLIYYIALAFAEGKIIPDPKRYRPEVHDKLFKIGIPVDQYAIPAIFKEVEIKTGTKLDKEVTKRMMEKKLNWRKEIERLKKES